MVIIALTQMLGVGTVALGGRHDVSVLVSARPGAAVR
jgi:hypothetical protein